MENNEISIYHYLSDIQIDKIISIIKKRCDIEIQEEKKEISTVHISKDIYEKLKKCRKAHNLTLNLYIDLYEPENIIEGFRYKLTENGNYYQPELEDDNVIIHIYYKSDLCSKLIKRRAKEEKPFYCIQFSVDSSGNLKSVYANHISKDGKIYKTENIFSQIFDKNEEIFIIPN